MSLRRLSALDSSWNWRTYKLINTYQTLVLPGLSVPPKLPIAYLQFQKICAGVTSCVGVRGAAHSAIHVQRLDQLERGVQSVQAVQDAGASVRCYLTFRRLDRVRAR